MHNDIESTNFNEQNEFDIYSLMKNYNWFQNNAFRDELNLNTFIEHDFIYN